MGKKFTKGYGAARTRGMGLQDEKLKPGKVTKAALGVLAAGLSAKKRMEKKQMAPVGMGAMGAGSLKMDLIKKILGRDKGSPKSGEQYKKYLKALKEVTDKSNLRNISKKFFPATVALKKVAGENLKKLKKEPFIQRRMQLGPVGMGARALEAAKATRYGKIAAGVAGVALLGKAALEKMYEKRTGKKPLTKRPDKKMGGGMMQRPNPVGYKTGSSIKVKCKLGKNKPTKLY